MKETGEKTRIEKDGEGYKLVYTVGDGSFEFLLTESDLAILKSAAR